MKSRRGIRFKASELEAGRTYLWRREFLPLLYKYLELKPRQSVVDVGSGTGSFTRLLANGIKFQGKVIGVERNKRLLSAAKRISNKHGISQKIVSYKVGKAESLPLPENFADRVVCQMVLWLVKERRKVIQEMIRVCKPRGLVGAIDCVLENVAYYYPQSESLTELTKKRHKALVKGYALIYGSDRNIGYKLPTLFKQEGLERVRLDAYAYVWLDSDDRVPFDFRLKSHERYVDEFDAREEKNRRKEEKRILLAGGMKRNEIEEFYQLDLENSKEIVRDPKLLDESTSMNSGIFYIATGIKP